MEQRCRQRERERERERERGGSVDGLVSADCRGNASSTFIRLYIKFSSAVSGVLVVG